MMQNRRQTGFLLLAGLAQALPGAMVSAWAQDPLAALLRQAQAARQRAAPPPPAGVVDLMWLDLSPPGWEPKRIMDRLLVPGMGDDEPGAAAILAEIRRAWERAPTVANLPKQPVRLLGFPVMLDDGAAPVRQVLLAPYYGACMHNPMPGPNQVVLAKLREPVPRSMYQFPVWVTGKISIANTSTRYGRAAYLLADAVWEPYPYQQYPLPQYQWPR